jgi:hypothetical protein
MADFLRIRVRRAPPARSSGQAGPSPIPGPIARSARRHPALRGRKPVRQRLCVVDRLGPTASAARRGR